MAERTFISRTAGSQRFAATDIQFYFRVETQGDRLRKWSNLIADRCADAMERGVDEGQLLEWSQLADELIRVADFIEPPQAVEVTSGTFPAAAAGTLFNAAQ